VTSDGVRNSAFDNQGKKIKDFVNDQPSAAEGVLHATNFVDAIRAGNSVDLRAEAQVGQASAVCCHMANLSHRLGQQLPIEAISDSIAPHPTLKDAFIRCQGYLNENGIDLADKPFTLGPALDLDVDREEFVGPFAEQANRSARPAGREPFVVPEIA